MRLEIRCMPIWFIARILHIYKIFHIYEISVCVCVYMYTHLCKCMSFDTFVYVGYKYNF